jgi:hypothetical protein
VCSKVAHDSDDSMRSQASFVKGGTKVYGIIMQNKRKSFEGKVIGSVQEILSQWSASLNETLPGQRTSNQAHDFSIEPSAPQGSPSLGALSARKGMSVRQVLDGDQSMISNGHVPRSTPGSQKQELSSTSVQFSLDEDQGLGHRGVTKVMEAFLLRICNREPVSSSAWTKRKSGMALVLLCVNRRV